MELIRSLVNGDQHLQDVATVSAFALWPGRCTQLSGSKWPDSFEIEELVLAVKAKAAWQSFRADVA